MVQIAPHARNFVKYMVFHPCARPWYVYVVTFIPAWIELVITVYAIDNEDLIRERGAELVREGPDRRGRRRGHRHRPRIPRKPAPTQRWLWRGTKGLLVVTGPLELIGHTFLVYHAADRFFYRWQSLLEQSDFCKSPIQSGPLQRHIDKEGFFPNPGGGAVNMLHLDQNRGGWGTNAFGASLPQGQFTAIMTVKIKGPGPGTQVYRPKFRINGTIGTGEFFGDPVNTREDEWTDIVMAQDFFLPFVSGGSIAWEVAGPSVPVGLDTDGGRVIVQRNG